jgi:hypothetical protein
MTPSPLVKQYLVHGVRIVTDVEHPEVSNALYYRLGAFETESTAPADFRFEYRCVSEATLAEVERPTGDTVRAIAQSEVSEVLYHPGEDVLYVSLAGRMKTYWDARRGVARVYFPQAELDHLWRLTHPMFTLPLVDALKRRGRYNVHAAGLSIHGKGLLFPGESGYGKTTLTLALLRAGFGFLSDDLMLLDPRGDRVHLLAFPDEIDVTENTARMFPELAPVLEAPSRPDWPKRQVRVAEIYGAGFVPECEPAAIIFPRVAHTDHTELEPMAPEEAFFELIASVTLTEQASSQAHLDAIGALLRQVPCYRMRTGRDLDTLPARLVELVA